MGHKNDSRGFLENLKKAMNERKGISALAVTIMVILVLAFPIPYYALPILEVNNQISRLKQSWEVTNSIEGVSQIVKKAWDLAHPDGAPVGSDGSAIADCTTVGPNLVGSPATGNPLMCFPDPGMFPNATCSGNICINPNMNLSLVDNKAQYQMYASITDEHPYLLRLVNDFLISLPFSKSVRGTSDSNLMDFNLIDQAYATSGSDNSGHGGGGSSGSGNSGSSGGSYNGTDGTGNLSNIYGYPIINRRDRAMRRNRSVPVATQQSSPGNVVTQPGSGGPSGGSSGSVPPSCTTDSAALNATDGLAMCKVCNPSLQIYGGTCVRVSLCFSNGGGCQGQPADRQAQQKILFMRNGDAIP